jgi:hypothetical protein
MWMHHIATNESKAKSVPKYEAYNTKDMKAKKSKFRTKNHKQKTKERN